MTDSSNNNQPNPDAPDYLQRQTGPAPVGTVIWLHGLGADATDFEPLVPMLKLPMDTRFIFPNAPERAITINAGMRMRGWYDIDPNDPGGAGADIQASVDAIEALLQAERDRGVPTNRIVLAGFSQGGVIALQLGLSYPERLAGIMALSTYVHDQEHLSERISFANADVPIFMAHGSADPMIPIARAVTARTALEGLGYQIDWHTYAMGHQVCPEEITHISQWLQAVLPA